MQNIVHLKYTSTIKAKCCVCLILFVEEFVKTVKAHITATSEHI